MNSKNGITTKIGIESDQRTHLYRDVRLSVEQMDWLSKIARADSVGHEGGCLCMACRMRRELES